MFKIIKNRLEFISGRSGRIQINYHEELEREMVRSVSDTKSEEQETATMSLPC